MQYNYYSLYNITEARASDKHLARIEKAADDQRFATQRSGLRADTSKGEYRHAKKTGDETQAAKHLKDSKASAFEAEKSRLKLHNIYREEDRLKTHIQDRKGEQGKKPVLTPRQLKIINKVADNKYRLKSEAENKARLKSQAESKARLKAEAAEANARLKAAAAETKARLKSEAETKARLKAEVENKARLESEAAKNKARLKAEAAENKARLKAAAKKKAAQHKTKIQQHGRKQKVGAVLAAGGLAGSAALFKSAHDDVTE